MPFVVPLPQARMYDFPPGSVTVCPLFSGHFQGNAVGVGTPVLVELLRELLVELLIELLVELLVGDVDSLLLVAEDFVELDPVLVDVPELDVEPLLELEPDVPDMLDQLVLTDIVRVLIEDVLPVAELELEELDELLGGPAEYTIAPAGWGMR